MMNPREYVILSPSTGMLTLVQLPERLKPYVNELTSILSQQYYGMPVDDDLLYCMNWTAQQWVFKMLDDVN